MKKIFVLLVAFFGASMLVHAAAPQQQQLPSATTQQPPAKNDTDKMGNGSGDDIDTIDEGDPSHDKDPEADDTSTSPGKS